MAKKQKKAKGFGWRLFGSVLDFLKGEADDVVHHAQESVSRVVDSALNSLLTGIFLLAGAVFVAVALAMLINDTFRLASYWGYLIIGLLIMAGALLSRRKS